MKVKVFYHDKCFDGACSAALFTRFYRERIRAQAEFEYHGLVHRAGALFNEADFTGDENAIVDFKYSASPHITWWFDHHQSAFLTPEDASHFEHDQSDRKFYDPDFRSCTRFIAVTTQQRFGFNAEWLQCSVLGLQPLFSFNFLLLSREILGNPVAEWVICRMRP